jgi:hypothetical protein
VITDLLLQPIVTIVTFISGLLPSVTFPSWLEGGSLLPSSVANDIGGLLGSVNTYLPVSEMLTALVFMFSLWPAIAGYVVFSWIWKHIPTIAGFGTGDG